MRRLPLAIGAGALLVGAAWWALRAPTGWEDSRGADVEPDRAPVAESAGRVAAPSAEPSVLEDDPWVLRNNEAVELLEQGQAARAAELFEACLAERPDDAVFRKNLGEALVARALAEHDEGRLREAVGSLERALELLDERPLLAEMLERWRTSHDLEEGFVRLENEHFELSFDGAREELLLSDWEVLKVLEDAYFELQLLFRRDPFREAADAGGGGLPKIQVTLYRREEFAAVTGLGDWAGGVFDGRVRVPVEHFGHERGRLTEVLHHELAHWFVRELGGRDVPGWLNEGLAQWVEPGRARSVAAARARLAGSEPFPLAKLAGSLGRWKDPASIRRAYAESLALVDRVATHYGESLLWQMLAAEREGPGAEEEFREATGVELAVVLDDLFAEL